MKSKEITETELFRKSNVFLLEKNRLHLEELKERASLVTNMEIDTSSFFRGLIEYCYENPSKFKDVIKYIKDYKGFKILEDLEQMINNGSNADEIEQELGIAKDIIESILDK